MRKTLASLLVAGTLLFAGCEGSDDREGSREPVPEGNVDMTGTWETHGSDYYGGPWPNGRMFEFVQSDLSLSGTCYNGIPRAIQDGAVSGNRVSFEVVERDHYADGSPAPVVTNWWSGNVDSSGVFDAHFHSQYSNGGYTLYRAEE